ncbi:hypothetical protein D9M68_985250 [compost metagenome]
MPCWSAIARSAISNSVGAGRKPPSPCTGSIMMAATSVGSISARNSVSNARRLSATLTPCDSAGNGTWNMPGGEMPNLFL